MKYNFFSYNYWKAIYILTQASMIRMNKHSVLGFVWTLLQPFVHMCIISYIFTSLLKQPSEIMVKNLAISLPLWNFLNISFSKSSDALLSRDNIIKKSTLPTLMFVISDIMVGVVMLGYSLVGAFIFLSIVYYDSVSLIWFLSLLLIIPFIISVMSVSVILGHIVPYIRDMPQIVNMCVSALYWTVPIVYPYTMIPDSKQWIFDIHPIYILIHPIQILFVEGTMPGYEIVLKSIMVMLCSWLVAYLIHKKLRKNIVFYL